MQVKLKKCASCNLDKVIWKNYEGKKYCKDCWHSEQTVKTPSNKRPIKPKSDKKDILEFEVGDIKWKDIEYIEEGKYKFKDQTKGLLIILNGQEYEEGYLEFKGDTINVIHNINGGVGERQTWIRKK